MLLFDELTINLTMLDMDQNMSRLAMFYDALHTLLESYAWKEVNVLMTIQSLDFKHHLKSCKL